MLTIVKNKNEIFISQIEELQNRNIDNNDKIQQLEAKLKLYKNDTIFEGTKGDKYKNLELQYKNVLEKNNKISNDLFSMKREIKELKEIKNKYNILIKEHESLLKTETLYNELLIKYNISQNNIKTLMNELNTMKKSFKKQQEEIESLKIDKNMLQNDNNIYEKNNENLTKEINELKKKNEILINQNNELINSKKDLNTNSNTNTYKDIESQISENKNSFHRIYEIQSNVGDLSFLNTKKKYLDISSDIHIDYINNNIDTNNDDLSNSFSRKNYFKENENETLLKSNEKVGKKKK